MRVLSPIQMARVFMASFPYNPGKPRAASAARVHASSLQAEYDPAVHAHASAAQQSLSSLTPRACCKWCCRLPLGVPPASPAAASAARPVRLGPLTPSALLAAIHPLQT